MIAITVIIIIIWIAIPDGSSDLPTFKVKTGEFVIDLKETGRLKAENSVTVTAPPVRTSLQIIDLVDEGTRVSEGDFVIQFDSTDLKRIIDDRLAELDIARANLARSEASMRSRMASLISAVENSRASHRLSQLRLEQMQFEADKRIEEGKLNLRQAEISLEQAEQQIDAQRQIDSADLISLELKIKQAEIEVSKAHRDMGKMRILAPAPGLVIYKEFWKGGEMAKLKLGDTPWRGQGLIELPDLSVMMVATSVSEVDLSKVKKGQEVEIKLDAYPDPVFNGEVVDVAIIASAAEGVSDARVFDVLIRISESDPLLRPGMSATARIIIDRILDKIWIPIEAVFNSDGKKVVWKKAGGSFKKQDVTIGQRNDNFVVIESGLEENDVVGLIDPTVSKEDRSTVDSNSDLVTNQEKVDKKSVRHSRKKRR
ncbi:MAG: efflux RND transporter periplasmic adaptor subunit [Candidatus Hatepunaea meridiana]|nr:efflux RND transporter periplasmic adaptor subunit [Candidatus Hatepunaea meridiana]